MRELELAIALSARDWPDDLHRFLSDHGGARVRLTAMQPADLAAESYDVLLVDDICSFLTPRLVDVVRANGRQVVGVYDPDEFPEGKDRLLAVGIGDVVESGAHPEEMLAVAARAVGTRSASTPASPPNAAVAAPVVVVSGPRGGAGVTEVAIGISSLLAARLRTCLVDADPEVPSVAQRLRLPPHPNLRTAVDIVEQGGHDLASALGERAGFGTLAGVRHPDLRPHRTVGVIDALGDSFEVVVVDAGAPGESGILQRAESLVAVGAGSPLGVIRLLEWLSEVRREERPPHLLVNFAPDDRFRRGEIVQELAASVSPSSLGFLPFDRSVPSCGWEGDVPTRGPFVTALGRWLDRFLLREVT